MPKISVILPVYNVEKYLEACLDSIIKQSLKDIEILCIDDGSTDASPKILRAYAKRDPRVKIITQKNSGGSSARNIGIKHATGEFIEFVDADDILSDEILSLSYDEAINKKVDVVFFNFARFVGRPTVMAVPSKIKPHHIEPVYTKKNYHDRFFNDFAIITWNKLIKKRVIDSNKLRFDEKLSHNHDVDFSVRLMLAADRFSYVDVVGYYYRCDNEGSLTATKRSDPTNVLRVLINLNGIINTSYKPLKYSFDSYVIDMVYGTLDKYHADEVKQKEVLDYTNLVLLEKLGNQDIDIKYHPKRIKHALRRIYDALQHVFSKITV